MKPLPTFCADWDSFLPLNPEHRTLLRLRDDDEQWAIEIVGNVDEATHQCVWVLNRPMLTHVTEIDGIVSAVLAKWHHWECLESVAASVFLRPGMTVLDIGANVVAANLRLVFMESG